MSVGLVVAALLALGCVVYAALPFLREPEVADDTLGGLSAAEAARVALIEQRDRAFAALRELELDDRTGKLAPDDYRRQRALLRAQAAEALQALESRGDGEHESYRAADSTGRAGAGARADRS